MKQTILAALAIAVLASCNNNTETKAPMALNSKIRKYEKIILDKNTKLELIANFLYILNKCIV